MRSHYTLPNGRVVEQRPGRGRDDLWIVWDYRPGQMLFSGGPEEFEAFLKKEKQWLIPKTSKRGAKH
jgi:hypothetical protein